MKILTNHLRISSPHNILKEVSSKMSISLNDHEKRIKALENNINSGSVIMDDIWSGFATAPGTTITLTSPDDKYNFINFLSRGSGSANYQSTIIPKKHFSSKGALVYCANRVLWIKRISSTVYKITEASYGVYEDGLVSIVGLKIYYIFRYNIIREFYYVKFKLRQSLCSLLQKLGLNKGGVKRCLLA